MSKKNSHAVRTVINNLFAHASIILSLLVLVCFVLDKFNDAMDFMTSDISKLVIGITATVAFINGIITVISLWKKPKVTAEDYYTVE